MTGPSHCPESAASCGGENLTARHFLDMARERFASKNIKKKLGIQTLKYCAVRTTKGGKKKRKICERNSSIPKNVIEPVRVVGNRKPPYHIVFNIVPSKNAELTTYLYRNATDKLALLSLNYILVLGSDNDLF